MIFCCRYFLMTITNDRHQNKCKTMDTDANSRSQYTIGSNDFIRK